MGLRNVRIWCLVCVLLGAVLIPAGSVPADPADSDNPYGIAVTRWVDPLGSRPITYREWLAQTPAPGPFETTVVKHASTLAAGKAEVNVCIIVNSAVGDSIQTVLNRYVDDLTAESNIVTVISVSGGTPEDLRSLLQSEYAAGMDGCVFIGDLPVAWFETVCWDENENEQFPCDLFYMDMDGVFADGDSDGMYDTHTGDIAPEIWMGRLTASTLTMDGASECSLLKNYFNKNHAYRTGRLPVEPRALVYIDDDWASGASTTNANVGAAYSTRALYSQQDTTWAPHYKARFPEGYDFIHVMVHSSPGSHSFKNSSEQWSTCSNSEVKAADPAAHFYNLFACSNARYVAANYMGGWYVFCDTYGLAAVGSTKTGSMLEFDDFYTPFGQGKSIGEAFRDWFVDQAAGGFVAWEVCWYYGMTLCGDPTLTKLPAVSAQNTFGPVPLTVDFVSDLGLPLTDCRWYFGDGSSSTAQDTFHEYTQPGYHDVSVTMTTATGSFDLSLPGLVSAYADTMTLAQVEAWPGDRVAVDLTVRNYLPLQKLVIPFCWSGPLNLAFDSFSTAGLRTEYFEQQQLSNLDYYNKRATITLISSNSGAQPYLTPGEEPVLRIWFQVPAGATPNVNPVELTSYAIYQPKFTTYAGDYYPELGQGSITFPATCCTGPSMGNVDGSSDNEITMGDLTVLIDHLFMTYMPLDCVDEANVDESADGAVTMGDLTVLIDHLFISYIPLPPCP